VEKTDGKVEGTMGIPLDGIPKGYALMKEAEYWVPPLGLRMEV